MLEEACYPFDITVFSVIFLILCTLETLQQIAKVEVLLGVMVQTSDARSQEGCELEGQAWLQETLCQKTKGVGCSWAMWTYYHVVGHEFGHC